MQLYAKFPHHDDNNAIFREIMAEYPELDFYHPSPEKAPWHVQTAIDLGGDLQIVNFWPHVLKAQIDGEGSVEGAAEIRRAITRAIQSAEFPHYDVLDPLDVYEG